MAKLFNKHTSRLPQIVIQQVNQLTNFFILIHDKQTLTSLYQYKATRHS